MRKLTKNKKALTPVAAAATIIAAMIAVALVSAILMASIATSSLAAKELVVTDSDFTVGDSSSGRIVIQVRNPHSNEITIERIRVNDQTANTWSSGSSNTVASEASEMFTITQAVTAGTEYTINMYNNEGTLVVTCTETA